MLSNPLIELVFEIRFTPKEDFATELLIAVNKVFDAYTSIIHEEGLQFPQDLKAQQKEFYYVPSYRIIYPEFFLLISDGSLIILKNTAIEKYKGWETFKDLPLKVLEILKETHKVHEVERFSLKYTNLISKDQTLDKLNLSIKIGNSELKDNGKFSLKTEDRSNHIVVLTDISSSVEIQNVREFNDKPIKLSGTLLIIDVINNIGLKETDIKNIDEEFLSSLEYLHHQANQRYSEIFKQ